MMRVRVLSAGCLFLAVLAAGCSTYWAQRPLDPLTPVERTHPVWIWSGGAVHKWYGVLLTQDSVSGIPFEVPLTCDSCRRSLPRTQVDSMRVSYSGTHVTAKDILDGAGIVTGGVIADILIEFVLCSASHEWSSY